MRTKAELVAFVEAEMKRKNVTKSSLGQALGAVGSSQSKVQRANGFLSDKSQKINMADVLLVAQFLDLDPKDIILKDLSDQKFISDLPSYNINPNHLVPLMSSLKKDKGMVNEWLVYPYDNSAHKKIVAVPMPDSRMSPLIKKGEILFVDSRLYSFSLTDRVILAAYANKFIVGRFRRLDNGQVQIYFEDSESDPVIYSTDNEHLEIVGVVISRFCEIQ